MMRTFMLPTMNFMIRLSEKNRNGLIKRLVSLLPIIAITLLFASCAKDPGQIGYIIQPDDSRLNVRFSDTSTIYGYSELLDSIRSDKLSVSAFGSLSDPIFGSTIAGFYTQFVLSIPGKDFGEGKILDSLVLQLYYAGSYGDTNSTLYAHTFEMLESISNDSVYYSNLEVPLGPNDYSNHEFIPNLHDSVVIGADTIPPVLRLNLSDINPELGQKLLDADSADLENTETFREYFAGLFVQSQAITEEGTIIYFGLTSQYSMLSLYYQNDEEDSLRYDFIITSATAAVNKYEHDYNSASSDFQAQILNGDTAKGQQQFYVQGYGGVQSLIKFPHVKDWAKKSNVAINEAKLILPGYDGDEFFGAPGQMSLLSINDDGEGEPLIDQAEGDAYFDGFYNKSSNSYEFRITRYIQSLISDTTLPNKGLYLYVFGGSVHPERFIFKGNDMDADSTGIKLEILYTDL